MNITIKIDNIELEKELKKIIATHKVITLDTLKKILNSFDNTLEYPKKDPEKHSRFINRDYNINDTKDTALNHIQDSAKFIHNLRREK